MISARPPESRSSVENSWKTRIGSSELRTVTALVEPDPLRPRRDGGEHDRRRRDGEVGPVVLADAEDVEPDLVGELGLLDDLAQALLGALALARVCEREDADLHAEVLPVAGRL